MVFSFLCEDKNHLGLFSIDHSLYSKGYDGRRNHAHLENRMTNADKWNKELPCWVYGLA